MRRAALAILLLTVPAVGVAQQGASGETGQSARLREDIRQFCGADQACYDAQLEELRHFLGFMSLFNDPDRATGTRCMAAGRITRNGHRMIDWTIATRCMREAARGLRMGDTLRP